MALSEEEIGARLAALEEGREPSWIAPGEGWSLAGAQTKIALRREGGQWYEARGCEPTTHILKPGITRMKEQALDEHLCLTTLREIGIPAARTRYARSWASTSVVNPTVRAVSKLSEPAIRPPG